jgi:hypothetical protein
MPVTTDARAATAAVVTQMTYVERVLNANLAGLTNEDSLVQPTPAGNCLNWVVGHLLASRNHMAAVLGLPPVWDETLAARYDRGTEPITRAEQAPARLEQILVEFNASQAPLVRALQAISEEQLSAKAPFSPTSNPEETVGSLLAVMLFHECYMVGQTGLLRRIAGKEASGK